MNINIIGCGLTGIVAANILRKKGHIINIYETRNHIGGNCYDSNVSGVMMHSYGPHIFHTDDDICYNILGEYTQWMPFKLQPIGNTKLGMLSLPYSKKTIKEIGRELSQEEIVEYIFKDYSEKQWGIQFDQIPKTITNRIPKTINCEDPTWFEGQKYQCIPKYGYTEMFKNMLNYKDINIYLNCDKDDWRKYPSHLTIYTGKIDEYFNYCYGKLPYRSLDFIHYSSNKKQPSFIINQCIAEVKYTRKYDHSYFTNEHKGGTIITEEYPKECKDNDVPFYPIPFGEGQIMYEKYKILAKETKNTIFAGRLATYKYMDMQDIVKNIIDIVDKI